MRILKYLFLLLLLSFVALTIFIATQKGDFTVERSKIINSPRSNVFSFVNDFRNWEDFGSWMTSSSVFWSFKDTIGGTKVTWKTIGKMDFSMKVYTAFNGGINRIIGKMYENSLANLDKTLDYEINTFTVKVDGLAKIPATFYLHQTFTSEIAKVTKNSRIVFDKINAFCDQNDIERNGKPFLLYHTYDAAKGLTRLSFCIPITKEIFTSSGSDILSGKLEEFEAVKTTLTGDYSHTKKALDKATAYINTNKIIVDPTFSHLAIFKVRKAEIKSPSKWVTEIYYPIKPKVIPPVNTYVAPAVRKAEPNVAPEPVIKEEENSEF